MTQIILPLPLVVDLPERSPIGCGYPRWHVLELEHVSAALGAFRGENMNFFEMTKTGELVPCSDLWRDGDADLSDVLKRLGFKTETLGVMGLEHIYWMAWYGREEEEGEGHAFIAEWEDSGRIRLILVPDWPTLIKLQALFASIVQTYLLASYMETFSTIACRAFHASHGHDVYKPCLKCDPTEVKRRQTWLERPLKTP